MIGQTVSTQGCVMGRLFANGFLPVYEGKNSLTICGSKTFANVRDFTDGIFTEDVCRLDSSPMIMVALSSVLTLVCRHFFKNYRFVCWK
jgi:hypothetical protein